MTEGVLKAVLWDLDGVIADTGHYHFLAWQDVFYKKGVNYAEEEFMRHFGQRHDAIIQSALGRNISPEELADITDEKQENFRQRLAGNIKAFPGAVKLLRELSKSNIKSAIASSAPMENIQPIIQGLAIEDCFQAIVWGMKVAESKPSPQIFLEAAKKLEVKPVNCIVVEDAIAGVAAAKRAGMKCLAVTNSHPRSSLKEADLIVDTLEAVSVSDLARLFQTEAG